MRLKHIFCFSKIACTVIPEYPILMQENTDQKNSEYGHFSRSVNLYLFFSMLLKLFSLEPCRKFRSSHPQVFFYKWCSENMHKIYRRTPTPKYDFNKVAKQLEIELWHESSPVNLQHIFATPFSKNISGVLLPKV